MRVNMYTPRKLTSLYITYVLLWHTKTKMSFSRNVFSTSSTPSNECQDLVEILFIQYLGMSTERKDNFQLFLCHVRFSGLWEFGLDYEYLSWVVFMKRRSKSLKTWLCGWNGRFWWTMNWFFAKNVRDFWVTYHML